MPQVILRDEPCICCEFFPTPWNGKRFNIEGRLCDSCFWILYRRHVRGSKQRPGPSCKIRYITCEILSCKTLFVTRSTAGRASAKCLPCRFIHRKAIVNAWVKAHRNPSVLTRAQAKYEARKKAGLPKLRIRPNQKLTLETAELIRQLYAQGTQKSVIAKNLGITFSAVYNVLLGLTHDPIRTADRYYNRISE